MNEVNINNWAPSIEDMFVEKMAKTIVDTRLGDDTYTKLRSLRSIEKQNVSKKPLMISLMALLNNAVSAISSICNCNQSTPKMCENYGHIIDKKNWSGHLPKCQDCGVIIKDLKELRRSESGPAYVSQDAFKMDERGKWIKAA